MEPLPFPQPQATKAVAETLTVVLLVRQNKVLAMEEH